MAEEDKPDTEDREGAGSPPQKKAAAKKKASTKKKSASPKKAATKKASPKKAATKKAAPRQAASSEKKAAPESAAPEGGTPRESTREAAPAPESRPLVQASAFAEPREESAPPASRMTAAIALWGPLILLGVLVWVLANGGDEASAPGHSAPAEQGEAAGSAPAAAGGEAKAAQPGPRLADSRSGAAAAGKASGERIPASDPAAAKIEALRRQVQQTFVGETQGTASEDARKPQARAPEVAAEPSSPPASQQASAGASAPADEAAGQAPAQGQVQGTAMAGRETDERAPGAGPARDEATQAGAEGITSAPDANESLRKLVEQTFVAANEG